MVLTVEIQDTPRVVFYIVDLNNFLKLDPFSTPITKGLTSGTVASGYWRQPSKTKRRTSLLMPGRLEGLVGT